VKRPVPTYLLGLLSFLFLGLVPACRPNNDATMAPPQIPSSFKIDVPPVRTDGRLSAAVQPTGYRLHLQIDPAKDSFKGEVFIDIHLHKAQSAIILHASNLTIDASEVRIGSERIRSDVQLREAAGSKGEKEELVLLPGRPVPAGKATLHITYHAPLLEKPHGIYKVSEGGNHYVFTQFEPSDARRMFPCFDDPIYKVPIEVSVDIPQGQKAFGNAPVKIEQTKELPNSGQTRVTFARSKPMPTYLVALAIGPLDVLAAAEHSPPIRVITTPGKAKQGRIALQMAKEQLAILERWFGSPYPYAKLDLVAVPNFSAGAMENAGLITFREELLLLDKRSSAASKRRVAMVMAHELAHQWFGNLVTMKWWDDLWLNEGFASFMEAALVDEWRPAMRAGLNNLSGAGWVMGIDALPSARAVRKPVSNTYQALAAFDGITYVKGSAIIGMLQHWLGRDAFLRGLKDYFKKHAWKNANANDAFAALSKTSKKDVAAVASTFLEQPGVPLVSAKVNCTRGQEAELQLTQQPFRYTQRATDKTNPQRWRIPVCVAVAPPKAGSKPKRLCTLLDKESKTVQLGFKGCPRWLQPNANHRGYYRYLLDAKSFSRLAKASSKQSTRDRIGLLTNAWAMVQANHLSAADLLRELPRFKNDQREVIREVISILTGISDSIDDKATRRSFTRFVSSLFLRRAQKLGWDNAAKDNDDRRLLRKLLLQALADLSPGPWLRRQSAKRAKAFLRDPGSLNPDTAAIALQVAAQAGDKAFPLDAVLAQLKVTTDRTERIRLVGALAHFPTEGKWEKTYDLLLDGTIRSQDAVYVVRSAARGKAARRELVAWLDKNAGQLGERMPQSGLQLMARAVSRICTSSLRKRAAESLKGPALRHGAERRLNEALERSAQCISMAQRQGPAIQRYLRRR
jgi:cytosol alanyl aminopeptidase